MYYKREINAFSIAKNQYNACREFERNKIINYLKERGLKPSQTGGQGLPCYTNGGKLERSYDLTNWKWINVNDDKKSVFISLQAFDQDSSSRNYHVLMDRIGLCIFNKILKKERKTILVA